MIRGNKDGKKQKQLLSSLSKYYLTFVLILTIIFVVSYLILGYLLSQSTEKNNSPLFSFINGRSNLSSIEEFSEIEKIDGYVEIINSNGNVEKTYGNIPENKIKENYTDEELFKEISLNNKNNYNTFINVLNENNEEYKILTRI
ncbi:MAG: hypothetical protein GX275_06975, partial [Clostridiales bacterium]|nr:hypothetical protein [Clostridiales bacterium]